MGGGACARTTAMNSAQIKNFFITATELEQISGRKRTNERRKKKAMGVFRRMDSLARSSTNRFITGIQKEI
jgi:hypothetical protein